tara:strand:- start:2801 stop:3640 length:840 start_codon:yes stop_codon:yes gene_type:complete
MLLQQNVGILEFLNGDILKEVLSFLENDGTRWICLFVCKRICLDVQALWNSPGQVQRKKKDVVWKNINMLQWVNSLSLSTGTLSPLTRENMNAEVRNGRLDVLEWVDKNCCKWDNEFCWEAAHFRRLDLLQSLCTRYEDGCRAWDRWTCVEAVRSFEIEILKFAVQHGCEMNEEVCAAAAGVGEKETLEWLHVNGCKWDGATCAQAAMINNLDVLVYAHENGCPWDEETCYHAVMCGSLDVLMYARENHCPWDEDTKKAALESDDLDVREWVKRTLLAQ